jgi:hypothetical protein
MLLETAESNPQLWMVSLSLVASAKAGSPKLVPRLVRRLAKSAPGY